VCARYILSRFRRPPPGNFNYFRADDARPTKLCRAYARYGQTRDLITKRVTRVIYRAPRAPSMGSRHNSSIIEEDRTVQNLHESLASDNTSIPLITFPQSISRQSRKPGNLITFCIISHRLYINIIFRRRLTKTCARSAVQSGVNQREIAACRSRPTSVRLLLLANELFPRAHRPPFDARRPLSVDAVEIVARTGPFEGCFLSSVNPSIGSSLRRAVCLRDRSLSVMRRKPLRYIKSCFFD